MYNIYPKNDFLYSKICAYFAKFNQTSIILSINVDYMDQLLSTYTEISNINDEKMKLLSNSFVTKFYEVFSH